MAVVLGELVVILVDLGLGSLVELSRLTSAWMEAPWE